MTAKKIKRHYKNYKRNKTIEELKHERAKKAAVGATSVILGAGILAGTNTRPVKASAKREENTELIATANNEEKELDAQVSQEVEQPVAQQTETQTEENTAQTETTTETTQKSYEDSKQEVEDINNSVNDELKNKVDEASKVDGVTVEEGETKETPTTVGGIQDNADKIKEDNQKQIEEIDAILKKHQEALSKYEKESAEYQAAKDAYLKELEKMGLWDENKHIDPSTLSQLLQLGKETNATVKAEGLDQNAIQGSGSILSGLLDNFWEVKENIAGDFLKVTYDNLENSTYNGKKIGKIEVTYSDFVISNNSYQNAKNPAGIYFGKNPTDGFFYRRAEGVTMDIKMYDEDGNLITLGNNTAYITIGSLNNGSSSTGHSEYVEKAEIINGNGQEGHGIALPESSITVHPNEDGNDVLYAETDNELLYKKNISKKDLDKAIALWGKDIVDKYLGWDDSNDRSKEIFGAGLFQVSGNGIKIRFSNELGSAWATFSTTIPKMTFDQKAPEKPTTTITWQPGKLVLNKNSNVHIHYIDVHEKASQDENFQDFNPDHGIELTDQLQSHTHLAIGDTYANQLWDWKAANYILATVTHDPEAENGTVPEEDKHVYVYLKRQTAEDTRKKEVNQVIHYVYKDSGETAAPDHVSQTLVFEQTGIKDLVTGETDWNGEWTLTQTFVSVASPIIKGYHADRLEVGPYDITVDNSNFDKKLDKEDTVYYIANPTETISRDKTVNQIIHYVYEDGSTAAPDHVSQTLVFTQTGIKDLLTNEETWGEWTLAQVFETVVSPTISGYYTYRKEVGPYEIEVNNENYNQNLDKEDTVIYLANPTERLERHKTVHQVIHYIYDDGSKAADDYYAIDLVFTQTGIKDLLTNEETWGEWTLAQTFETVVSPIIPGYTADRKEVGPYLIEVNNDNFEQNLDKEDTVIYTKDAEPTNPTDQPTDPTNPTTPTTPEQPTVPEESPTNPTTPPVLPEDPSPSNPTESEETETLDPEYTVDVDEKETTVPQESDETVTPLPETMTHHVSQKKQTVIEKTAVTEKQETEEKLPETGAEEERAGWLAAIVAALGLTGLLGTRKMKEDDDE